MEAQGWMALKGVLMAVAAEMVAGVEEAKAVVVREVEKVGAVKVAKRVKGTKAKAKTGVAR